MMRSWFPIPLILTAFVLGGCPDSTETPTPGSSPQPTAAATATAEATSPQVTPTQPGPTPTLPEGETFPPPTPTEPPGTAAPTPTPPTTDNDGDGYGPNQGDCDDGDAFIYPGANEICNGDDDDCDGRADEGGPWFDDFDGDGYGEEDAFFYESSCDPYWIPGWVADGSDCDDFDEDINPGETEVCDIADTDEDCDRVSDDDDPSVDPDSQTVYYIDGDGDGWGEGEGEALCDRPSGDVVDQGGDCDDDNADINPGETEICDGVDQDCDGQADNGVIWYADVDDDGYGDANDTAEGCPAPEGYVAQAGDCDDGDAEIVPGAEDAVCDGVDDDCDGTADEDYAAVASCGVGLCADRATPSSCEGGVETACAPGDGEADDTTCDGVDDDCDETADEDYVAITECGVGICAEDVVPSSCTGGQETACAPSAGEADDATCDELDDDCDGVVDEDCMARCGDLPSEAFYEDLCDGACPSGVSGLSSTDVGSRVGGIVADGDEVILSLFDDDVIRVVGASTGEYSAGVDAPTGIALEGGELFVGSINDGVIRVLDVDDGAVQRTLDGAWGSPRDMAYRGDSLWAMDRDRAEVLRLDPSDGSVLGAYDVPLADPAGFEFCMGFPLATDRTAQTLHLLDIRYGQISSSHSISAVDEPYGLSCLGDEVWIADLDGEAYHQATLPVTTYAFGGSEVPTGDALLPNIEREACSPYVMFEVAPGAGKAVDIAVAGNNEPVGVAVFSEQDEPLWGVTVAVGGVGIVPDLVFNGSERYYVEVTALTADAEGTFNLWATQRNVSLKEVSGTVTGDGQPLEGAVVYYGSDNHLIQGITDGEGDYELGLPVGEIPDYVILTAAAEGFPPQAAQVDASTTASVELDFALVSGVAEVVIPGSEEVTHLGDGNFSGAVNSQFQKDAIGTEVFYEFTVSAEMLELESVTLSLLLKGAEYASNAIEINGVKVAALSTSPSNGSYGEVEFPVWVDLLNAGANTLRVTSSFELSDPDDYDDFEFAFIKLSFAEAQDYDALGSFYLPAGLGPLGLTWVDDTLYVVADDERALYTFDLDDYAFEEGPSYSPYLTGITSAGDGVSIWAADVDNDRLIRLSLPAMQILDSLDAPGTFSRDLDRVDDRLWVMDKDDDAFYAVDIDDGSVLDTKAISGEPAGLEVLGGNFWLSDRDADELRLVDSDLELVHTITGVDDPYAMDIKEDILWVMSRSSGRVWAFRIPLP